MNDQVKQAFSEKEHEAALIRKQLKESNIRVVALKEQLFRRSSLINSHVLGFIPAWEVESAHLFGDEFTPIHGPYLFKWQAERRARDLDFIVRAAHGLGVTYGVLRS